MTYPSCIIIICYINIYFITERQNEMHVLYVTVTARQRL